MTEFGKLVRDRIPEIIEADGRHAVVEVLAGAAYRAALLDKLREETSELARAEGADVLDELADVYEVLLALVTEAGLDIQQVGGRADDKAVERGRFRNRLFLARVTDEPPG